MTVKCKFCRFTDDRPTVWTHAVNYHVRELRDWLDNAYRIPIGEPSLPIEDDTTGDGCAHCGVGRLDVCEVNNTSEVLTCCECGTTVERAV